MELEFRKGYKLLSVLMKVCKLGALQWLYTLRSNKTPRSKGGHGIREKGTEKKKIKWHSSSYLFSLYLDSIGYFNSLLKKLCFA